MTKAPPSLMRRLCGIVEPALQHNGFAVMFLFVYGVVNAVFFVHGATIGYSLAKGTPYLAVGVLARAGGVLLDLNSALVIVVASKSLMTYLRRTALNMIVPFDKAMPAMHSIIGNVLALSTVLHVVFQTANYIVNSLWARPGARVGVFGFRSVLLTGVLLLLIIAAMRATALVAVRKRRFEAFFWTHHVGFALYFGLLVVHGVRAGVPMTYRYVAGPVVVYLIDRAYRFSQEKGSELAVPRTSIVRAGDGMVNLRLPRVFQYLAGQYCEVRIPEISQREWHPFTIASSPHESEMLFFIKDNGDWTHKLFELAGNPSARDDKVTVHVRGPHGAPAQHVGQYEHVVLISGGVGATPFAAIAKYAHHWIMNYTARGAAAAARAASVSDSFTRNHSSRNSSVPGTPRLSGSLPARSRDLSMSSVSRGFSRSEARSFARSVPRAATPARPLSAAHAPAAFARLDSLDLPAYTPAGAPHARRAGAPGGAQGGSPPALGALETALAEERARGGAAGARRGDAVLDLGDPDAPIPARAPVAPADGLGGAAAAGGEEDVVEFDSSLSLFSVDGGSGQLKRVTQSELAGLPPLDAQFGAVQLEEEILRANQSGSNTYKMLGMSFDSVSVLRHFQHGRAEPASSVVRAGLDLMDGALDTAHWTDRVMFYLHTVTLNWVLLCVMVVRFGVAAVGIMLGRMMVSGIGLDIYNSRPFAIVDFVLACLLFIPVAAATATEVCKGGLRAYLKDQFGNFFDLFALLPLLASSIALTAAVSFGGVRIASITPITVFLIWPLTGVLLLWRAGRTIGSRISLAQYFAATHAQTKSLDFIWTAKKQEEDAWLINELLPLAGDGIVRLHRFITRSVPQTEAWMANLEKVPLKTTYRRPDWDEVFGNLVERSRSGTVVGVFFCGPDPMARAIQQAAMKAMAKSVENSLQRGYTARKKTAHGALSKVGELARTLSTRGSLRRPPAAAVEQPTGMCAFGCNVRISVRIENFS